ncbi:MAG TPA: [FeFe] hydrogenase H-cluster radical SAM maturase HydE, partial [Candidatus Cloacimonadota bacterium]|nr:[FeFe] hydrogenase H-cluster radical SAM maturase HydE [Candidatus Cloacimonadota bacterium]
MNKLQKIVDKAYETEQLSREEIILHLKDDSINEYLYAKAHQKKQELLGNEIHLRALIEISNICLQNCLYCGLRRDNSLQERYKLSKDEILFLASTAKQ